jgi:hypothetical protein
MKRQNSWRIRNLVAVVNVSLAAGSFSTFAQTTAAPSANLEGRWAATLTHGSLVIPFRLDISGSGDHVVGTLYGSPQEFGEVAD